MKKMHENKYSELKITIYALDNSLKAVGNVSYKLINNPITENSPKKPNKNNESGWKNFLKKPVNLFFMTLISCGVVSGFITWIILKNQLNKKIGGKRAKKIK